MVAGGDDNAIRPASGPEKQGMGVVISIMGLAFAAGKQSPSQEEHVIRRALFTRKMKFLSFVGLRLPTRLFLEGEGLIAMPRVAALADDGKREEHRTSNAQHRTSNGLGSGRQSSAGRRWAFR